MSLKRIYSNKNEFPELHKLSVRKQKFVWYYLDRETIDVNTQKTTFNDAFASYLATNKINAIYHKDTNPNGFLILKRYAYNAELKTYTLVDKHVLATETRLDIVNAKLFEKHLQSAKRLENECLPAITEIRTKNLIKDEKARHMEIMDAVHNDSLYHNDLRFKVDNRKLAFKMYGLDKQEPNNQINIFENTGKRVIEALKKSSGKNEDLADLLVGEDDYDDIRVEDSELNNKE